MPPSDLRGRGDSNKPDKGYDTRRGLPIFAGRWNDAIARHYTYDIEPGPGGGVPSGRASGRDCRLVVVPERNHYTIVLGEHPLVTRELRTFLAG